MKWLVDTRARPVQQSGLTIFGKRPMSDRISTRLSQPLAEFVGRMVGEAGFYETPGEYVRDLIRRDMEQREMRFVQEAIADGYRDAAAGRMFESSGNFSADMALLDCGQASGWQ